MIGGLVKVSLVDWPGRVAAVVFTRGCNFRCPWCHNRSLVEPALFPPALPEEEVLSHLARRRGLLTGVVVSGGEPTLHTDLVPFLRKVKEMGYAVKLDTNGSRPEFLGQLLTEGLVDRVAVDYKVPLDEYPARLGWAAPQEVRRTIALVVERGCGEVRTTVVPGIHSVEVLRRMVREVTIPPGAYRLQPFRPGSCLDPAYNRYPAVTGEEVAVLAAVLPGHATAGTDI